jgi:tRNA (mo5U34)-methyltransferase
VFTRVLPDYLTGKSVRYMGCIAGFYSLVWARRGARRVLGVDHDQTYLRQAEFARAQLGLAPQRVEFRQAEVYDLKQLGEQFDLVLFMGVLYHLKHPLYALEVVTNLVRPQGGRLLFQTMERGVDEVGTFEEDYPITERGIFHDPRFPRMYFVEHRYTGDWTNWWIPNSAASMAMLRSCGMRILERPCGEVYLCEKETAKV